MFAVVALVDDTMARCRMAASISWMRLAIVGLEPTVA